MVSNELRKALGRPSLRYHLVDVAYMGCIKRGSIPLPSFTMQGLAAVHAGPRLNWQPTSNL